MTKPLNRVVYWLVIALIGMVPVVTSIIDHLSFLSYRNRLPRCVSHRALELGYAAVQLRQRILRRIRAVYLNVESVGLRLDAADEALHAKTIGNSLLFDGINFPVHQIL